MRWAVPGTRRERVATGARAGAERRQPQRARRAVISRSREAARARAFASARVSTCRSMRESRSAPRGARAQQAAQLRGERIRGRDAGGRAPGDGRERAIRRRLGETREVLRGVFDDVEAQPVETSEADEKIGGARPRGSSACRLRGIGVTWPASPLTTRCCSQSPMTPPRRWSMSAAAPLAGTPRSTATAVAAARALATSPTRTRMVSGRAAGALRAPMHPAARRFVERVEEQPPLFRRHVRPVDLALVLLAQLRVAHARERTALERRRGGEALRGAGREQVGGAGDHAIGQRHVAVSALDVAVARARRAARARSGTVPSPCRLYSYSKSPSRSATPVAVVRLQPTTMLNRESAGAMRCSSPAAARSNAASGPGPFAGHAAASNRSRSLTLVVGRQQLVQPGKTREHVAREIFGVVPQIEHRDLAHHRIRAAQRLHRGQRTRVRRAEHDELRNAFAGGMRERGARHQPAHAVADQRDVVAAVGGDPVRE